MMSKNFTRILVLTCYLSCTSILIVNAQRNCATMAHEQYLQQINPQRAQQLAESEIILEKWMADHPNAGSTRSIDTIPVVVHVLYHYTSQNISDEQIFSQIDVLNEDFSRTNADTVNTPVDFQDVAGTVPFRFCLAQRDPLANPTTGIERRYVTNTSYGFTDEMKFYDQGGLDAWDVNKYMNIWVVDFGSSGILGFGEFPTNNPSNTFGAVIQYSAFGRVGLVLYPYDKGRTCTHEFSHCFNLFHIWGDDGGGCNGTDLVQDTPNQGDATFGCPNFPHTDNCSPSAPGIMFMNYMDYSDDACMNMLTMLQSDRMVGAINSFYPTLLTSDGCVPGIIYEFNAALPQIISPTEATPVCSTTFSPEVKIKNWGSDSLTTVTIVYQVDNNPQQSFTWNGFLGYLETEDVILPSVTTTAGTHTLTAYTVNPNGAVDQNPVGDTSVISVTVDPLVVDLPQTEGFESVTFPPVNWFYNYVNAINKWKRSISASGYGLSTASVKMDNFSGSVDITGQVDDLIMPSMDFTGAEPSIALTFDLAYCQFNNTTNDSLIVRATADCGDTWITLLHKGGSSLATAPDQGYVFIPDPTEWVTYSLSLSQFVGESNVKIEFRSVSGYGNNLYLDNINIDNLTGIGTPYTEPNYEWTIVPNPTSGQFTLTFTQGPGNSSYDIRILNAIGQEIFHNPKAAGTVDFDLRNYPGGTYMIMVNDGKAVTSKKLILNK